MFDELADLRRRRGHAGLLERTRRLPRGRTLTFVSQPRRITEALANA